MMIKVHGILVDVESGTLPDELYDAAIEHVASTHRILTVDDVWQVIGIMPRDREAASVIGPRMKDAQRLGIIEPTGEYIRSVRVRSHGNLMRVWRSLIF